jgi:AcrR family transcriptional regulator
MVDSPRGRPRRAPTENRKRKIEERRRQILAGALSCFEQKGFHEASMNDIANAAGMSPGLIYQYCSDKRDVLFQVILEILEAYNREVPRAIVGLSDPLVRFQAGAIAYYKVIDSSVSAALLAYRETKLLDRDRINVLKAKELQTNQLLIDCLQGCIDAEYCADIHPELTVYWVITTAHAWGLKNWRLRSISSFENYVRRTLQMILNAVLNEKGKAHFATHSLLDG